MGGRRGNPSNISANNNPTNGENQPTGSDDMANDALGKELGPIARQQESFYSTSGNKLNGKEGIAGITDAVGTGKIAFGTDSLFNPFYVFRYAKYGTIAGESYSSDLHRDISMIPKGGSNINSGGGTNSLETISEEKRLANNPSASQIINWASTNIRAGENNDKETTVAPYPYQWNDFLWCKWYGKIPNNRLLTLRRYPIPIEDNIQVAASKGPLIPIAQAVTWWGEETENTLSSILGMTWGFKWKPISAEIQEITGNEVNAKSVLDLAGIENESIRQLLLATLFTDPNNPFAGTGYDDKVQDWVKNSYSTGPYWNRVLGPINIIKQTQIRDTGYDWTHEIKLTFAYKLRTFNNINPKIAMLDLITNFLALTHNKAEFWGGGVRYFQKTGYIIPGLSSQKFENGDFIGGIQEVLSQMIGLVQKEGKKIAETVGKAFEGLAEGQVDQVASGLTKSIALQNAAGNWVKDLLQKPLSIRSFLDGRATGEWHLTVGNPMNPLAVIGNLCLKQTTISFSDSLGADDFPTEVKFTVSLNHGRHRAKQDIESMFNLGGGDMSFTALSPPSSAFNSYGERNSLILNNFKKGRNDTSPEALSNERANGTKSQASFVADTGIDLVVKKDNNLKDIGDFSEYFKLNVARAYGVKWAKSPAIPDYFKNLKTKD